MVIKNIYIMQKVRVRVQAQASSIQPTITSKGNANANGMGFRIDCRTKYSSTLTRGKPECYSITLNTMLTARRHAITWGQPARLPIAEPGLLCDPTAIVLLADAVLLVVWLAVDDTVPIPTALAAVPFPFPFPHPHQQPRSHHPSHRLTLNPTHSASHRSRLWRPTRTSTPPAVMFGNIAMNESTVRSESSCLRIMSQEFLGAVSGG